jgi:hypothetical protein
MSSLYALTSSPNEKQLLFLLFFSTLLGEIGRTTYGKLI